MPVNDESAASFARGPVICCGGTRAHRGSECRSPPEGSQRTPPDRTGLGTDHHLARRLDCTPPGSSAARHSDQASRDSLASRRGSGDPDAFHRAHCWRVGRLARRRHPCRRGSPRPADDPWAESGSRMGSDTPRRRPECCSDCSVVPAGWRRRKHPVEPGP